MANTNTSTQKGTKKGGVVTPATDTTFLNNISTQIYNQLHTNFTVLGANPDSFRTILGIIGTETGRNVSIASIKIRHVTTSKLTGTGSVYWNHTVIKNARKALGESNPNLLQGLSGHSLMAVMGWNNIRGLEDKFPYLLREYKNLAEANGLILNPGDDIDAVYTSDLDGAERAIMAGMMILESKYKSYLNKKLSPQRALVAATRAYLGFGKDQTGTTTSKYFAVVSSLGLKLLGLVTSGKQATNKLITSYSTAPKSTIQTTTNIRGGQPNIIDVAGQGSYIPPGTTSSASLSPGLVNAAGLTPEFTATVPSVPLGTGASSYVLNPGMTPIPGSSLPIGSGSGTINGATADAAGMLSVDNTIIGKTLTFSKSVLNYAGIPTYALGLATPKPNVSLLNADSTIKNASGVIFPVGGQKPIGPIPDNAVINVATGKIVSGGTLLNDPATVLAAASMPVGVIGTKTTVAGVNGATSNGAPVPQPGC